jgi:hypothetical protein
MNVDNAMHKYKNALHGLTLAVELLARLSPNASPDEVKQVTELNSQARRELTYSHKLLTDAKLESIGL